MFSLSQRQHKSTYWTHRCRSMLGRLARENENPVDKRYRWMLGHLARADDNILDKRLMWESWKQSLTAAQEFDDHTPSARADYQARRNEQFPEFDWDDEPNCVNSYVILLCSRLSLADKDIVRALHCREVLLKACRAAEMNWRHAAATLNPQLTPTPGTPLSTSACSSPSSSRLSAEANKRTRSRPY